MKPFLMFLLFFAAMECTFSQTVNIPDANFLKYLIDRGFDTSQDGFIQAQEVASVTNLNLAAVGITDLTGIEAFVNLDTLNCSSNTITSINLSQNTRLTALFCSINKITGLDISGCTGLKYLFCSHNKLTSIDVSPFTALKFLDCSYNKLSSLDLSANSELTVLECYFNKLTKLDLSAQTKLINIYCDNNQLDSLDFSACTKLETINCSYNFLTYLNLSNCTPLTVLSCYSNHLSVLDLTQNINLLRIDCGQNWYKGLDLSKNTSLTSLDCADSDSLLYICVSDSAAVGANTSFYKDDKAQWVENCSLLTPIVGQKAAVSFLVAPNPSNGSFNLTLDAPAVVQITNATGNEIEKFSAVRYIRFGENYAQGLYFVTVVSQQGVGLAKLVKE